MPNPATIADIESRWRPLSAEETTNAGVFIEDAWRMLKRRVADLEANVEADADLKAEAVRVISQATLRVMKNPDGKRQESIDDYSWTRDQATSAGLLYFTSDEIDAVSDDAPLPKGAAFTIDTLSASATLPSDAAPLLTLAESGQPDYLDWS